MGNRKAHGQEITDRAYELEYGKLKERTEAPGQEKKVVRKARSVIQRHARPPAPPAFLDLTTSDSRPMAGLRAIFSVFEREILRERVAPASALR